MFLSRRSNGLYYLWFEDEFGKRRKVSTRTTLKSEANKFLRTFRRDTAVTAKPKRLSEFIKEFLAYTESTYSVATHDICRRVLALLKKQVRLNSVRCARRSRRQNGGISSRRTPASRQQIPVPDKPPVLFSVTDSEKLVSAIEEG